MTKMGSLFCFAGKRILFRDPDPTTTASSVSQHESLASEDDDNDDGDAGGLIWSKALQSQDKAAQTEEEEVTDAPGGEVQLYSTVEYGYLHHFGASKFDAKIRLMQISVKPQLK